MGFMGTEQTHAVRTSASVSLKPSKYFIAACAEAVTEICGIITMLTGNVTLIAEDAQGVINSLCLLCSL